MSQNLIKPYRNIPFDLGASINDADIVLIKNIAKANGFNESQIPEIMIRFSKYLKLCFTVNKDINLYIYSFGVGVFTICDDDYSIINEKFAVEYCESRKESHHLILNGKHKYSEKLHSIIKLLREGVKSTHRDIRPTANEEWESNGLSYVMTVSFVQLPKQHNFNYNYLNDVDKRNLLIMLEPGLAHQEDTLLLEEREHSEVVDLYEMDISQKSPTNWMKANDYGLYISWAAVVLYSNLIDDISVRYLEYMEADLQAMWMYVYCMYYVVSHTKQKEMKISDLKRELYKFKRMYNEFTSSDDSNISEYFKNIRNELIRTSGIKNEKDKYVEYLNFCIEDIISLNEEKTRKYSIYSEIMLFVIAYAQIAPLLYHILMGDYTNLGMWQILSITTIAIIGAILIVRKE